MPSLALAAAALVTDGDIAFEDGNVRVGDAHQRLMADGSFLVNFRGDPGTPYPRVAPSTILGWSVEQGESGEVPEAVRRSVELWIGCVAGALEESEFKGKLHKAGFEDVAVTPFWPNNLSAVFSSKMRVFSPLFRLLLLSAI